MTIEVKYLTKSGEYKNLEFPASESIGMADLIEPRNDSTMHAEASEKKVWSKTLASLSGVPEIKVETCHRRVRIPGNGNVNVPYPCTKTREGRHWIELNVFYPSDLAQDAVDIIVKCATEAAAYTAGVIAASIIAPQFMPAAIPTAQTLFVEKFKSCVSEEIFNSVTYTITHEQESGDWH
ncbi:hypothetical protein [Paenibacillus polymyxa]|uniref:hypothetical protein n=1 Tax=Paenibacillus polymyxa TaxID=1406 RepID=UPI002223ADF9|nr:hypothetical protein [Paenibacillus polymyxa]